MNIIQMALLGLIAVFGWCEYVDGINKSTRPIVMCTLVGLVLGDLPQGIVIGGTLELATMGMMGIGISIPINITIAGVLGAGFAISSGLSPKAAVALAIPMALSIDSWSTWQRRAMTLLPQRCCLIIPSATLRAALPRRFG